MSETGPKNRQKSKFALKSYIIKKTTNPKIEKPTNSKLPPHLDDPPHWEVSASRSTALFGAG